MKIRTSIATAAVLGATVAVAPLTASAKVDMKIGFVTINDGQHKAAKHFAEELAKRSKGEFTARVFPAAQLGTIPRQIEGVLFGTQEAFISPPGFFVGLNKAFMAADAPGLFTGFAHQSKTLNHPTVREKFLNLATAKGVTGVYLTSAGASALSMRDPVRKIADVKGKKIRVLASPIEVAIMKELGAAGTPMAYSEVLPAIQRRVLDGASSAVTVMGPSKFYTAAKYLTPTSITYIPTAMWCSAKWMEKLSAEQRKMLNDIGKELTEQGAKWSEEDTATWEKKWGEEGGTVLRLDAAEHKAVLDRLRPIGDKILSSDPAIAPMYSLIKAAAKETM
jgi:TRAP-type C4-dicarboxylate transport system substrate-binding protein